LRREALIVQLAYASYGRRAESEPEKVTVPPEEPTAEAGDDSDETVSSLRSSASRG
jgi:hypothetical protein